MTDKAISELSQAFARVVQERRSVRGFLPDPVPRSILEQVFTLAQRAPSNCNTQPWLSVVVSGRACERMREALQDAVNRGAFAMDFPYEGKYHGVFKERQYDAARQLYDAQGIAREDKAARGASFLRNYAFFGAPHAVFLFLPEWAGVREAADLGMYAQTLMLAMTAHGIASCPQTSLSFNAELVREQLEVEADWKLLFAISFGYEDCNEASNRCRVGRATLGEAVHFRD